MLANHIGELLEIVYMDQTGKLTQRRIEIKHIRNGRVYADCLRSGEPRTFKLENILAWQPSKAIRPTISVKQLAAMTASESDKASFSTARAVSAVKPTRSSRTSSSSNTYKRSPSSKSATTTTTTSTRSYTTGSRAKQPALRPSAAKANVSHVS